MAKVTLEFDPIEDSEALEAAMNAEKYKLALWDISQQVFRPHRKHGYPDEQLNKLNNDEKVNDAITMLEKMFYEILEENNVKL